MCHRHWCSCGTLVDVPCFADILVTGTFTLALYSSFMSDLKDCVLGF